MRRRGKSFKEILIFYFSTIAILPFIISGLIIVILLTNQLKENAFTKASVLSDTLSTEIEYFLQYPVNEINEIREMIGTDLYTNEEINQFLDIFIESHEFFDTIILLDHNGDIASISPFRRDLIGDNMMGRPFIRETIERNDIVWSTPFVDYETGNVTLALNIPYRDGIITIYINLQILRSIVKRTDFGDEGFVFITDDKGALIAHPDEAAVARRKNVKKYEIVRRSMESGKVSMIYSFDNVNHIGSSGTLPSTGWIIVVTQPVHNAFEIANNLRNLLIVISIIILALVVFVSLWISHKLAKPLNTLAFNAKKIADGDYSLDLSINRKDYDEVLSLSNDFLSMVEAINVREEEILYTKNYLKTIFDSLNIAIISVDSKGIISQWNNAAEIITGLFPVNTISKNIMEVLPQFGDFENSLKSVITNQKKVEFTKIFIKLTTKKCFNISIYPLSLKDSQGAVISLDDITEYEKREEELLQIQKMETVGNLAGGLAHDFNNVLSGITGTLSLLEFKLNKKDNLGKEVILKYLNTIKASGNRAANMVEQLLNLTRKKEVEFVSVDLNQTLKNVVKICENTFDKSINLKITYYKEKALVLADQTQLEQILLNCCVNASHAMTIMRKKGDPPGGDLSVLIKKVIVDKNFQNTYQGKLGGEFWRIQFNDTGIGMSDETIKKIFDPFFTTKEHGKGTGLGLAMVFNLVKNHNGFIYVYSEVGVGSTFNLYLPVQKLETEKALDRIPKTEILQGTGFVLIADDEEVVRDTAEEILEECGYDILLAKDGIECIELYKENYDKIKIVLLDMNMPNKSGKDTYLELVKINKNVKVIISSGFISDERVLSVLKLGVNNFIQKPYTLVELSKIVYSTIHGTNNDG